MDQATTTLIAYLKQNASVPVEKLKELCLASGYTNEQFAEAFHALPATPASIPTNVGTSPTLSISGFTPIHPEGQAPIHDTNQIPVIFVDPTKVSVQKKASFSIQSILGIMQLVIFGSATVGALLTITTVAYLAATPLPK